MKKTIGIKDEGWRRWKNIWIYFHKEIAAEAKKQLGYDLDKKKMHCEPIKNLGFHDVAIKVHPQVTATLRVKVEEK